MRFSVVIATYNRKDLLRRCLMAVTRQDYPDYEVIVVDDGSTDGTEEMVQREFPQVRYIRQEPNRGPAAARNRGIEAATGEIVAFTDDDCEPPPNWLRRLQSGFEHYPEAGAVGGIQEAPEAMLRHNLLARYESFLTRRVYGVGERPVVGRPAPGGTNNLAVKRPLLERLKGFDESFPLAAGEDADLLDRLAHMGYTTVCLPVKVTHHQDYSWPPFLCQQVRRGIGAAYFQHKRGRTPTLLREIRRLLATPLLFVGDLWRYRSFSMIFVHHIRGVCQLWGRLRARPALRMRTPEFCWQAAPSSLKWRYVERYAAGRTALDIGTGYGFYGRRLQELGYQVIGVDLNPQHDAIFPLVAARLSALPFAHPFDTVLALDVLEHEEGESQALIELRRLTHRRLILSVPSADHERLLPYNLTFKHHLDKTHQREYSAEELREKLEKVGFRVLVLRKEGPVSPALLAEFVRPVVMRPLARLLLRVLHRLKVLHNSDLMADLYVVAEPKEQL